MIASPFSARSLQAVERGGHRRGDVDPAVNHRGGHVAPRHEVGGKLQRPRVAVRSGRVAESQFHRRSHGHSLDGHGRRSMRHSGRGCRRGKERAALRGRGRNAARGEERCEQRVKGNFQRECFFRSRRSCALNRWAASASLTMQLMASISVADWQRGSEVATSIASASFNGRGSATAATMIRRARPLATFPAWLRFVFPAAWRRPWVWSLVLS